SRPELVADAPFTTWRNRGRKLIAPNIDTPMMKLTELARLKVRLAKRCTGTTGSAARRSITARTPSSTTDAAMRPRITGEPHSYSVPPHVVNSTIEVTAATSTAEPV